MLIAIVLGGLAAAFAAPVLLSSDEDDEDLSMSPDPEVESAAACVDGSQGDDRADMGETFEISVSAGEFEIADFAPGSDKCILHVADTDALIETGTGPDGVSYLRTETAEGDMIVTFEGLQEVPLEAVHFVVPHGDGASMSLSLSEILERGAAYGPGAPATDPLIDEAEHPDLTAFEDTLGDLGVAVLVLPEIGDVADDAFDLLDELIPLTPGAGDLDDHATAPIDDTLPIAPAEEDPDSAPPEPIDGLAPLAPVTDDLENPAQSPAGQTVG